MPRGAQTVAFLVLGVLVMLAGIIWYVLSYTPSGKKLGGAWEMRQTQSLTIGSGHLPWYLERVHGRERTKVATDPFPYSYLGDDCVLFTTWGHGEYEVRAACGDRPPVLVTRVEKSVNWDDVQHDPVLINGTKYSWAEVKQHALRGEPF